MMVAAAHPHMRCLSVDLPVATTIAERKIAAAGLADRVSVQPLDFFNDPLPRADVITGADFGNWCAAAGFRRTEVIHLAGPASAGVACK